MSKPTGKLIRITTSSIGAVPVGRKVNNKPLSADVSLSAGDVGAYGKTESDNKYQPKGNYAPTGNYAVKGDSYTKTESDGRYQPKGSYQPTGNYALKGDSYTKAESYNRTDIDKKIGAGSGLGVAQTWNDYKSQRAVNTVYTNSTGKPIMLSINFDGSSQHRRYELYINNLKVYNYLHAATTTLPVVSSVIPNGATYKLVVTGGTPITSWFELR